MSDRNTDKSIIRHKKLGLEIQMPEITQGGMEKFEEAMRPYNDKDAFSLSIFSGGIVRTAAKLGWLPGISEDVVSEMKPATVEFMAGKIAEYIQQTRTIPPE